MTRDKILARTTAGALVLAFVAFVAPGIAADSGVSVPSLAEHNALAGRVDVLEGTDQTLAARADALEAGQDALTGRVDDLESRLAALEAAAAPTPTPTPTPEPTPEAQVATTQFGACPTNPGGFSASAQQTVVDKFGPGASIRQFGTDFTQVAAHVAGAGVVHVSWKPGSVAAITESAVAAATANLEDGDIVEVWHEIDKKIRDGVFTRTEGIARKNAFYDVIQTLNAQPGRPQLLVANTLTGWEADPDNGTTHGDLTQWYDVKADVLGLDLDGIDGLPDYADEVPVAVAFVDRPGDTYTKWSVPEFGGEPVAGDADDSDRVAWVNFHGANLRDNGAYTVAYYDYVVSRDYPLDTPASVDAWRTFVASNAA